MVIPETLPNLPDAPIPPAGDNETISTSAPLNNDKFVTVTLMEPIVRGETTIDKLTLRKPKAGELRGTNLEALLTSDVTATLIVLTRISEPVLTAAEADALEADDFAELGGAIRGFFMTAPQKAAVQDHFRQLTGNSPSTD